MSSRKKSDFQQRFNLVLALLAVFLLVLTTNLVDQRHFNTAQETINTVYEDRVVAQHYIFEMSSIIYQKEEGFLKYDNTEWAVEDAARLEELVELFAATKLTQNEQRQLESLQKHLSTLQRVEEKYRETTSGVNQDISNIFQDVKNDLNNLADTQLQESRSRMHVAQKSLNITKLLSNLELGLLIVLGIAMQFVIFYRVKRTSRTPKLSIEK